MARSPPRQALSVWQGDMGTSPRAITVCYGLGVSLRGVVDGHSNNRAKIVCDPSQRGLGRFTFGSCLTLAGQAGCRPCADNGREKMQQKLALLDHLVGAR